MNNIFTEMDKIVSKFNTAVDRLNMKYTINGKQYSEFDINKRCAELMGLKVSNEQYMHYGDRDENVVLIGRARDSYASDPCNNQSDTWPIIEKCSDMLLSLVNKHGETPKSKEGIFWTRWQHLQELHNCSKLVAACICLIETNQ